MKKTLSVMSGMVLAAVMTGIAAQETPLVVEVSTPGPDYYADGTPVLVGETYLLVYVKAGATFAGVRTDGSLIDPDNNKKVFEAKAVEGAKCGFIPVQYLESMYPANGSWVVVLLDTRKADGSVGGLVAAQGAGTSVAGGGNAMAGPQALSRAVGGMVATSMTPSPADTPPPVITALNKDAAGVALEIGNVSGGALYTVVATDDLAKGASGWQPVADRVQGRGAASVALDAGQETGGARFFKVIVQ